MTESKLDKFERIVCATLYERGGYRRVSEGERGDKPRSVYFIDNDDIEYKVRFELVERDKDLDKSKGEPAFDCDN